MVSKVIHRPGSWDAGLIPAFFRIRPHGRKNPEQKGIRGTEHQLFLTEQILTAIPDRTNIKTIRRILAEHKDKPAAG